jgi:alpha-D-ribose 1-methylphosphonate 5-triphosphate diphosphatase
MLAKMHDPNYLMRFTQRTGLSPDALKSLLERVAERAGDVPSEMARMALRARTARIPLASHDDEDLTMRAAFRELGCAISEFPKTEDVANDAVRNGEHVIFGAPNVVRGGSHLDGIAAAGMVERGLCTVLASDYYYPALLQGALRLVREGILDLARAWALVSGNPAAAGGLNDRGAIAPGQRADFIVVDDRSCEMPGVVATFVAGRSVYVDGSLERRAA